MKTDRREFNFLAAGTALGAMLPVSGVGQSAIRLNAQSSPATGTLGIPWYKRVRRVGQTNFNEKDPENANVEQWANYWGSCKVDAVALSVSGPVAFYPTEVPFFHRSAYLNGRDLFGECTRAVKERGIRVYGRMSPDIQWTDPKLVAQHPLWFRRNQDGSLQQSAPDIAFTCIFSEHYTHQQLAIIRELNARYDIDGIYMNGWPTIQVCYCDNCRKIGDPLTKTYKDALMNKASELIDLYKRVVLEKSPNNFYSCNLGGGIKESGLDQWRLTREALWYTADNQSRQAIVAPIWQDAQQVKFAHALMGARPVAAVTASYARAGNIMWRNVADSSDEPLSRMAQTSAAGGIVWYHWLGLEQGFNEDKRWQERGREFLSWHAKHDQHWRNSRSMSRVAILAAPRSVTLYTAPTSEDKTDSVQGMYSVLVEARIPFDFVHEEDLTQERLDQYTAILMPNIALLSDAQCRALEAYVDRGGSLLATFETSLYDETGKRRTNFALGELFGITADGERQRSETKSTDPITAVHLQLIRQQHAITTGFENTKWIAGPIWSMPLKPIPNPIMTMIAPYPVYPPEAVYMRQLPGNTPSVVLQERGSARLAYLAGDMDSSYWRLDNRDLGQQMLNIIQWLLRGETAVSVEGDGLMEVFAWETEPGFAVHMVNYNGPHAFRGHMRKLVPLGPQTLRITLPRDARIKKATLLDAGTPLKIAQRGRIVELSVPAVRNYEVVALEV